MLKKVIAYTDYNGVERKEEHFFNLNKAEIMEMELSIVGGLTSMINRVVAAQDGPTIMKIFKDLILKSYGIKSPDGIQFEKSEAISRKFEQSGAYDVLFMELVTDAKAAADFINGIVPADVAKQMKDNPQLTAIE